MPGPVRNPTEAYQQLEAIMLRQMLQSSGAFRASSEAGAQIRTDMFVETLADAVAKAGGLGIARMLERQLGAGGGDGSPSTHAPGTAGASFGASAAAAPAWTLASPATATDDLDDPNSEAPLPEDPAAASIDDYQTAATRRGRPGNAPSVDAGRLTDGLPGRAASGLSGFPGQSTSASLRALNRYKERVETTGAGTSVSGVREKP